MLYQKNVMNQNSKKYLVLKQHLLSEDLKVYDKNFNTEVSQHPRETSKH